MDINSQSLACVDFGFASIHLYLDPFPRFDILPISKKTPKPPKNPPKKILDLMDLLAHYRKNPESFSCQDALPFLEKVSPFQKKVYESLCQIPYGSVLSYLDLARQLKTAPRAIGQACKRNPLPFLIPCHRIIAKNHLGGYAGEQDGFFMQVKIALLKREGIVIDGNTSHSH